jgi:FtsX-like permease family
MGAVRLLAGLELRRRWRATLAIVLLIGVVGAIVLATAAGARRSTTALERFNDFSRSSDVEISVGRPTARQLDQFRHSPGVGPLAVLRGYSLAPDGLDGDELAIAAPLDARMGRVVDRSRLISGREADPDQPLEMTIGEGLARQRHLRVGSTLDAGSFTQEQIDRAFAGGDPGAPAGPQVRFRVVGIVRRPLDLGVREAAGGVVVLTPAFARTYEGRIGRFTDVIRAQGEHGARDVPKVVAASRRLFGDDPTFGAQPLGIETEGARSAIDVITLSLWIVAAIAALAGLVTIAIVLSRDVAGARVGQETLNALGLTRRHRIAVAVPRALIVASGGALVAGIGAVLLSPRFPIGVARRADPNVGLHADWTVLAIGIPVVIVLVFGIAMLSAVRATRSATTERITHAYRRTSSFVERAGAAGLSPAAANGLRMAVQPGRGDQSLPVRSAFAGAVFGVAGITAALVFAASLGHLASTPSLYGWTFDVRAEVPTADPCIDARSYGLERDPAVAAVGVVCLSDGVQIDGHPVTVMGFRSLHGTIAPEMVEGRAPRSARELAVGTVTLHDLGKRVGDPVRVGASGGSATYRIVGRAVFPAVAGPVALADGAAVTSDGFKPLYDAGGNETQALVARTTPGANRTALERKIGDLGPVRNVGTTTVAVEVSRLEQIDRIPLALAVLLGILALIAVTHAIVATVRRRRDELALLKVLGFSRSQVRATVGWQATLLGGAGVVVGIPLGLVVGRWSWQLVADGLGVRTEISNPALWLLVAVVATLAVVNLIALLPARAAARTRPAAALRTG